MPFRGGNGGVLLQGVSIGSWIFVLISSTSNTENLLTSGNQGTLFTGRARQNPPPGLSKLPLSLLHPLGLLSLQSIPLSALRLTFGCPGGGGSSLQDDWPLCTNNTLAGVRSTSFELCLHS